MSHENEGQYYCNTIIGGSALLTETCLNFKKRRNILEIYRIYETLIWLIIQLSSPGAGSAAHLRLELLAATSVDQFKHGVSDSDTVQY